MVDMASTQRDAFLKEPRIGMLTTVQPGGGPFTVPIWYEWDGERARIFTHRASPKVARIRADERVCLAVAEPAGVAEAWVSMEGSARIEEEGGFALAQRLAPRYYTAEQAARALAGWQEMAAEWVVIVITPRRIRSLAPG